MTQGRESALSPNEKTLDDINQLRETIDLEDQSFPEHSTQKIWAIFAVLQLLLFVACVDQTSVNTSVPELVQALGNADTIGWVGTSFLIARCSSQMIPARFSDIFGRKVMLTVIIVIYIFANVLGGYARDSIWLFTARGVAGVGNGGINSLCMIVLADVVPLKDSAQYQGLLSMSIGLGNGLGPLIGGALSDASWRWVFCCGLLHALKAHTDLTFQIIALLIIGIAVGMTLQTVTVIAQAGAPSKDRAIVTGIRNTGLTLGGAIGLAACGNIRNTVVRRQLTLMTDIPRSVARKVVVSGIASARGELDSETYEQVLAAVMSGLHGVFSSFIPLVAGAMILSFCIENRRLSERRASRPNKDEEAVASS
ncbi:hypothetical protein VKT23_015688 [Stygiomarasmius scandens]|uniref:Major facilitator superfamily (MFS) profile domain-containing protein n=1 Tax=Marasmiellus scandens TaxID=2682957 RepID=A0ABR1IWZ9_9AGAR